MTGLTRRRLLGTALGAGALAVGGAPGGAESEIRGAADLVVRGPVGPSSVALVRLASSDAPGQEAPRFGFQPWQSTDELQTALGSGACKAAIMPTPLAAELYNGGTPLRLASVVSWGRYYVISTDPKVIEFEDLKGRTLLVSATNQIAELVFRYIAQRRGLAAGRALKLQTVESADEALKRLLARKATLVLADEPLATLAIVRGIDSAVVVKRPIDLQAEWNSLTGKGSGPPDLGLVVADELVQRQPALVQALTHGLAQATTWVVGNPQPASRLGTDMLQLPAPVIELCLKWANLDAVPAAAARPQLEFMFSALATVDPKIVAGKLPDAKFYLNPTA
jgi:NitT/TauT family transport system substrate-binding protein